MRRLALMFVLTGCTAGSAHEWPGADVETVVVPVPPLGAPLLPRKAYTVPRSGCRAPPTTHESRLLRLADHARRIGHTGFACALLRALVCSSEHPHVLAEARRLLSEIETRPLELTQDLLDLPPVR